MYTFAEFLDLYKANCIMLRGNEIVGGGATLINLYQCDIRYRLKFYIYKIGFKVIFYLDLRFL